MLTQITQIGGKKEAKHYCYERKAVRRYSRLSEQTEEGSGGREDGPPVPRTIERRKERNQEIA
jgi:hypothetical protein